MNTAIPELESGWCTFLVGDGLYGVPLSRMQEVLRPQTLTRVPLAPPAVAGLLNLRGRIVPAVDLRTLFGLERRPVHGGLIVIRSDDGPVALLVDEIGDVQRVPAHLLEAGAPERAAREDADGLTAATIPLADRLLVVLDPERTLAHAFARAGRDVAGRSEPAPRPRGER